MLNEQEKKLNVHFDIDLKFDERPWNAPESHINSIP